MEGGLLLDVVVAQSTSILKLLASKDESLLVRGDAFLVLDFGLDVFDGITCLDFKGDGLSSECLDEDLHATTQTKDKVEGGLLLDVVVTQSTSILKLLASKDESLLVWGDAFLVLDFGLHVFDGIAGLHLEGDGLSGECLDEDLHLDVFFSESMLTYWFEVQMWTFEFPFGILSESFDDYFIET